MLQGIGPVSMVHVGESERLQKQRTHGAQLTLRVLEETQLRGAGLNNLPEMTRLAFRVQDKVQVDMKQDELA
ncbi:hypothetical protein AURDEDRAFT_113844 [Auricularia subglabra TFB-10046 SS5]|nr:hypothetical protein AURDEDRAFT_113844 [Auricularia subglabra TFB-10046 SS5]